MNKKYNLIMCIGVILWFALGITYLINDANTIAGPRDYKAVVEQSRLKNIQQNDIVTEEVNALVDTDTSEDLTSNEPSDNSQENSNDTVEKTVWIGENGTKYHDNNCRTLRGNKYEITLQEAINQGREPCKVCNP